MMPTDPVEADCAHAAWLASLSDEDRRRYERFLRLLVQLVRVQKKPAAEVIHA